jgi:hypothetical protein
MRNPSYVYSINPKPEEESLEATYEGSKPVDNVGIPGAGGEPGSYL